MTDEDNEDGGASRFVRLAPLAVCLRAPRTAGSLYRSQAGVR